ncbi:MAG: hypothetical protein GOVbin1807_52 [Prokaryotic dsDNA virus sp.]|nr:MAG: hypothetical protein GOVbin1807_52 [Prokaryotic dsDNA virus sp.]|tara:strand:+ start:4611 stop:4760 length:150 start_codon:yes stop_codon:yes gene_type:complete
MMDAYVLFIVSYLIAGIGIIACIMAYFTLPMVIKTVLDLDDETEESEKE